MRRFFWNKKNIVSVQNDVGLKRSISVIKRLSMTWLTSCVFVCFCCFHEVINFIYFSKSGGIGPLGHLFIILAAIIHGYLAFTLIILWKICSSLLLSINVQSLLKQTAVCQTVTTHLISLFSIDNLYKSQPVVPKNYRHLREPYIGNFICYREIRNSSLLIKTHYSVSTFFTEAKLEFPNKVYPRSGYYWQ